MGFGISSTISCPVDVTGIVTDYQKQPYQKQSADETDELGNTSARTYFGSGTIVRHEVTYQLKCDASIGTVTLGEDGLESISIETSNGDWPTVSIVWYTGLPTCQSGATFSVTPPAVAGKRKAQPLGITNAGGKLSSTSWSASCSLNVLPDEDGEPAAYAFSGGEIEASAEATGGTFTAGTGLTLTTSPTTETRAAYGSASAQASGFITGTEVTAA